MQFPKRSNRTLLIMTLTLLLFYGIPGEPAWAQEEEEANGAGIGLGIASFLATIPYGAVKIGYAGLGAIVGGFAFLLTGGDEEPAQTVWDKSMKGTYVLTPKHLTGEEPIRFLGP